MTSLTGLISSFAEMLSPARENEAGLQRRIAHVGEAEGVNTKTKMIKRQM